MQAEACQILVGLFNDSENKIEMLIDLWDAHIDNIMAYDKYELKRRGMFRSNSSVSFLTYTVCLMLQNSPDPDLFTQFS